MSMYVCKWYVLSNRESHHSLCQSVLSIVRGQDLCVSISAGWKSYLLLKRKKFKGSFVKADYGTWKILQVHLSITLKLEFKGKVTRTTSFDVPAFLVKFAPTSTNAWDR